MIKGVEKKIFGEKLKELGMFCLEKRRLRGRPWGLFQVVEGWHRELGEQLFSMCPENRTRGNRLECERVFSGRDSC